MTFVVLKRIDLSHLGEGWKDAFATFTPFSANDNRVLLSLRNTKDELESSDEIMRLLTDKFIEGMGFDGKKLVPITKENLGNLPMSVIAYFINQLQIDTVIPPKE